MRRGPQVEILRRSLANAWSRETSADPVGWSEHNAAWGQCAVTALIVQDFLGGQLMRGDVGSTSHYWNRLPSGSELDLTAHQFGGEIRPNHIEERERAYVLSFPETVVRYHRLSRGIRRALQSLARTVA